MMIEIPPRSTIDAKIRLPGSKSLSHRALIAAGLATGNSRLTGVLDCEDTRFTIRALERMGVSITENGGALEIEGIAGRLVSDHPRTNIFLGNSGTSMRLLLSMATLGRGVYFFDGTRRMRERPVGELVKALNGLGAKVLHSDKPNYPPVLIRAKGLQGGKVSLSGTESSQYLSSLLLAGAWAKRDVEIEVKGTLVSTPYVDLTLDVMKAFGVRVFRKDYRSFTVPAGAGYRPCRYQVEADASNASYFWAAAAVTGGVVVTENIDPRNTSQGDIGFLDLLEKMGCMVERKRDCVTVRGAALSGIDVDMGHMPDLVPTLAAVALFAKGKTTIRNVPHLRLKESDRLEAVHLEWEKLGGRVVELNDGLIVYGGDSLTGRTVNPHDDHRLAMSLAVIGLRVPGVKITQQDCVNKSFPGFWGLWEQL
jgi:3-phosphoshikimate 1-carboxyvinyltransferase